MEFFQLFGRWGLESVVIAEYEKLGGSSQPVNVVF